jgi:hypothetical protein
MSYDSNSSLCHFASLQRNDISCLSNATIRQLQALGPQLSPCNCDNPCARFPTDDSPPCRNAINKTECTSSNCSNHQCTNRLTSVPAHLLPILRVISSHAGVFGYALYTTTLVSRDTFLGNVYGEVLTRQSLASRHYPPTDSFVLDYRSHNLCLDLTRSSNQFCHLSHSCNPTARLELWHLRTQPIWRVFTNCDIPSQHLVTIDFTKHHLPTPFPCICGAPTCASPPDPTLHVLSSIINAAHPPRTQTSLEHYITINSSTTTTVRSPQSSQTNSTSRPPTTQASKTLLHYYKVNAPASTRIPPDHRQTQQSPTNSQDTPYTPEPPSTTSKLMDRVSPFAASSDPHISAAQPDIRRLFQPARTRCVPPSPEPSLTSMTPSSPWRSPPDPPPLGRD